jgi:hypothetical protein
MAKRSLLYTLKETLQMASGPMFPELMRQRKLADFLLDADSQNYSPQEIGAYALFELLAGNLGPLDQAICLGVVRFLDRTVGLPASDTISYQRLKDLKPMIRQRSAFQEYLKWAKGWYG